jgi:hypothetical protein
MEMMQAGCQLFEEDAVAGTMMMSMTTTEEGGGGRQGSRDD